MTTRGIRRKKSYLVDAKIAVCGEKAVGKSGMSLQMCFWHEQDEKQQANNRARRLQPYPRKYLYNVHLEPFSERKTLSRAKRKMFCKTQV